MSSISDENNPRIFQNCLLKNLESSLHIALRQERIYCIFLWLNFLKLSWIDIDRGFKDVVIIIFKSGLLSNVRGGLSFINQEQPQSF